MELTVNKDKVLEEYSFGNNEQKKLIGKLFGKDLLESELIIRRIKTFDDAINALGDEHPSVIEYRKLLDNGVSKFLLCQSKISIIVAALNNGWKPWKGECQKVYMPLYERIPYNPNYMAYVENKDIVYKTKRYWYRAVGHYEAGWRSLIIPERFCLKSKYLADYAAKAFAEEFIDYFISNDDE